MRRLLISQARQRAGRRAAVGVALAFCLCSAAARADIKIEIDGVDGDIRRNVLAFPSLERYRDRDRLQEDTLVRLYNRVDDEVRSALRPFGYYEPVIATQLEKNANGSDYRVHIEIQPGQPVIVSEVSIQVHGGGANDEAFTDITDHPLLHVGARLHHGEYEQVKGDLQRTAASNGYFDARLTQNQMLVDTAAHTATIRIELETGDQYRFGDIRIDQSVIRHELMSRFLRFRAGDPYSAVQLLRTQFALDDSQYFSSVEVLPLERDVENHTVPVSITATKGRRQLSLGIGYGTDTDIRGTIGWVDPLINSYGHRFRAEIKASSITRRIDSRYDIPIGDPALERFSIEGIEQDEERATGLDTTETTFRPLVTQVLGNWQRVLSVAFTNTQTKQPDKVETANLIVPGISYASVPEGFLGEDLLNRGVYLDLIGSHSALGSSSDFVQAHVQLERVFDFWNKWHLLLRAEAGASLVENFDDLPGIYRFYAGGDRSVRGFGYNSLSPTRCLDVPLAGQAGPPIACATSGSIAASAGYQRVFVKTGGRHLAVGTVEVIRDLPRNLALATFVDVGNAFNRFGDPLEYAAGLGLRFRLPVVTIGMDIAQPLSESGSPRLHLNISPKL